MTLEQITVDLGRMARPELPVDVVLALIRSQVRLRNVVDFDLKSGFFHVFDPFPATSARGGLVHDYAYKYKTLLEVNKKKTMGELTQKRADEIFRDINIIVNGFYAMNYLAYWSLRIGGFVAWNGHRKRNAKIPGIK